MHSPSLQGLVENGEQHTVAAKREFEEETGLTCDALHEPADFEYAYDVRGRIKRVP